MASDVAKAGWFEAAVAVLKKLGDRFADLDLETRPFPGA